MPSVDTTVALDHPAFAGHFPGRPLLPGVALLAEVLEALAWTGGVGVPVLKFLSPVLPGDRLHIEWTEQGARVRFEVWASRGAESDGGAAQASRTLAASGQLERRP